ncbi:hypothetical protein NLJ89_g3562 [Agrocybe chaxingu]|uniref:Uncharacterized protein n=1 Tax=Agrocybe chaxingu TaxID=84603 RepID=A0A9W8KAW3_9AGAR|nr:hypothetical protein NLJ89_g3562 [Agrocybe chaxingu]
MLYLAHFVLILSLSVSSMAQKHVGTLFNFVPGVGACGFTNSSSQLVGSVSNSFFNTFPGATSNPNKNPLCRRSLLVQYNSKSVKAQVVDFFVANNSEYNVGLSSAAFAQLADVNDGIVSNVTCAECLIPPPLLPASYERAQKEIEALLASSKERERVLNNLIEQNNRLRAELDQSEAVVSGLRTENSQLQAQVAAGNGCPQREPRALHPQREMKLKPPIPAAHNFVAPQHHPRYPKPDHISTTEVVERVTALNKEISDLAASLSHLLVRHRHLYVFKHCDWKERHDAAEAHLSKDIVSILSNQPSKGEAIVNPLISRIAIQVLIVKLLFRKIMAEEPQGNKSASGTVYGPARAPLENRPQTHTLPLEEWKNEVLEAFANACFVAEWTVSDQEHVQHQIFDSPVFNLGYELRHILSTTRKNATEYVELKMIRPKTLIFDPFLMDEAFIDPKIPARPGMETKVAGTTAMGLVKVTLPRGTDGLTHQLILKPKVVMKSGLLASQNYQAPAQPNIRPDRPRAVAFEGHVARQAPTLQSANPRNWYPCHQAQFGDN